MPSATIADRIAHDLKAALSPIQTSAYLLRQGSRIPEASRLELVAVIERQTQRLARMIDEATLWSRAADSGLLRHDGPVDPADLFDLAVGALDCSPAMELPPPPHPRIRGDMQPLREMLVALLEYCAHRQPGNEPVLGLCEAAGEIRLEVRAAGGDVDVETLLHAPLAQPWDDGLGLRLMIARAIAEAHRGQLRVAVPEGGGVCFSCHLPRWVEAP